MGLSLSDAERILGALDTLDDIFTMVEAINTRTERMEAILATEVEQLTALSAKVDDLVSDVRAALEILRADQANLSTEGQEALDSLVAKVDAFDTEIGDADGSDTPPTP